ncbi:MAG: hypothetical protein ACK56I_02250, partial [bacterium]
AAQSAKSKAGCNPIRHDAQASRRSPSSPGSDREMRVPRRDSVAKCQRNQQWEDGARGRGLPVMQMKKVKPVITRRPGHCQGRHDQLNKEVIKF